MNFVVAGFVALIVEVATGSPSALGVKPVVRAVMSPGPLVGATEEVGTMERLILIPTGSRLILVAQRQLTKLTFLLFKIIMRTHRSRQRPRLLLCMA